MLRAGTLRPIPTEPLCIPDLCLAGRLPQQHNAVFNLDLSAANAVPGAAADVTAWPEFHNGVAAGIRLAPGDGGLTRTWVVYNKPKTPNYTHAGMLMGLGLAGMATSQYLLRIIKEEGGAWGAKAYAIRHILSYCRGCIARWLCIDLMLQGFASQHICAGTTYMHC